jgi:hypothetical protein
MPPRTKTESTPSAFEVFIPPIKVPQPDGSIMVKAGTPKVLNGGDWITTREAAVILNLSQRRVEQLIRTGTVFQRRDLFRTPPKGQFKIKRSAVLKLRGIDAETASQPEKPQTLRK